MNINKKEFEYLNNKPTFENTSNIKKILFNIFYYTTRIILEAVYIITCVFCTIIELMFYTFTFRKRRKLRRRARWLI